MTKWYIKDLSKLTGVSRQTLHHYDKIGLLAPSARLESGYRLYSEEDLSKLQQIIALKFFGFNLNAIKKLLSGNVNTLDHFLGQVEFLEKKGKSLLETSDALRKILNSCSYGKPIPWKSIIKSIEVYKMNEKIVETWAEKILSPEEMEKYKDALKEGKCIVKYLGMKEEDIILSSKRNVKVEDFENFDKCRDEGNAIFQKIVDLMEEGKAPNDSDVEALIRHHATLTDRYHFLNKKTYSALAEVYRKHPHFIEYFKVFHPKLHTFLADAMDAYASKVLA